MKRPLIINAPSRQSLRQRYYYATLTFIFWMIWIFLWTPAITLLGWIFGMDLVYIQMVQLEGYKSVISDFGLFLICVLGIGSILGAWATYNFLRFKGVERRASLVTIDNQQLSSFFRIDLKNLDEQQHAKVITVSFDKFGNIIASKNIPREFRGSLIVKPHSQKS